MIRYYLDIEVVVLSPNTARPGWLVCEWPDGKWWWHWHEQLRLRPLVLGS